MSSCCSVEIEAGPSNALAIVVQSWPGPAEPEVPESALTWNDVPLTWGDGGEYLTWE
jgi:hypothetical protein